MAFAVAHRAQCSRVVVARRAARPFNRASALRVRAEAKPATDATPTTPSASASPASSKVLDLTDKNFEEVIKKSEVPVLVDFWAPWCGPCRFIAPLIDDLATEYSGRLLVAKVNTDESAKTASDLGIRSIPTVMIFKGGEKMDSVIGAVPKPTLVQTIEKYLNVEK